MTLFLDVAARNLVQAPRRTLLLGLALFLVTLLFVMLFSLTRGMTETMFRATTVLMSGHVNVGGWHKYKLNDAGPMIVGRDALLATVRAETPGLDYAIDRYRGWGKFISESTSIQCSFTGIDLDAERDFAAMIELAEEREYRKDSAARVLGDVRRLREPDTIIIFAAQAKRLEVGVGDTLTLFTETGKGQTNTKELTIVAVAKNFGFTSSWATFVNKDVARDIYQLQPDTTGVIQVYLRDPRQSERVMGQLRKTLEGRGHRLTDHDPQAFFMKFTNVMAEDWVGQKLDLTTWRDEATFLEWQLTLVNTISVFLVGVLALIIAVGIMNATWITVRERTAEVGMLRAIGMSRPRVLTMFLVESLLLGLVATALGGLCGAGLALGIDRLALRVPWPALEMVLMSDTLRLSVSGWHLLAAVATFTLISGLGALWPAMRASRLQPITAIQRVN
jgi:putative ABC transport system permease protein